MNGFQRPLYPSMPSTSRKSDSDSDPEVIEEDGEEWSLAKEGKKNPWKDRKVMKVTQPQAQRRSLELLGERKMVKFV